MPTCEEIGARLKRLREQKQMTQAQLAEKMNTSRESINLWERGARDMKTGTICALAKVFNVSCDYLLTGTSAENITLAKDLGLTNNAIEKLRLLNSEIQYPYRKMELKSLNFILEHCHPIARFVCEYLTTDFSHAYRLNNKPSEKIKENGKLTFMFEYNMLTEKTLIFKNSEDITGFSYLPVNPDIFDQSFLSIITTELKNTKQYLQKEGVITFDNPND